MVDPCGPPPPPPPTTQDTCSQFIQNLESDTNFIGRMQYLNSSGYGMPLGFTYEVGYEIRDVTQYNSNTYKYKQGLSGQRTIDWDIQASSFQDGLIHSHYASLNSIFTPEDVILMAQLFLGNHAKDSNNLFFAVTSSYGVPNLMKVGNPAIFRAFCEKIVGATGEDTVKMAKFINKFELKIDSYDPDLNEKNFLQIIKYEYGAENGLVLYQGNAGCNSWKKRRVDNFGYVSTIPCVTPE